MQVVAKRLVWGYTGRKYRVGKWTKCLFGGDLSLPPHLLSSRTETYPGDLSPWELHQLGQTSVVHGDCLRDCIWHSQNKVFCCKNQCQSEEAPLDWGEWMDGNLRNTNGNPVTEKVNLPVTTFELRSLQSWVLLSENRDPSWLAS